MNRTRKAVVIGVIVVVAIVAAVGTTLGPGIFIGVRTQQLRVQLLSKTDHRALLEACRELSRQVANGKLESGSYAVRLWRDPEVAQFPEVIRRLRPRYVGIYDDGHVRIEMFGGWDSFGVYAYPEDFKKRFPGFEYHDRELLPGLWYYDERYRRHPDGAYDKKVDAFLRGGKRGHVLN